MEEQEKNEMIQQVSKPLSEAKGWIKFLGVLSILASTMGIVAILFMGPMMFTFQSYQEYMPSARPIVVAVLFLIAYGAIVVLCIRLGIQLIQLSSLVEVADKHSNLASLHESQRRLKAIFVNLGIVAAIAIVIQAGSYLISMTGLLFR